MQRLQSEPLIVQKGLKGWMMDSTVEREMQQSKHKRVREGIGLHLDITSNLLSGQNIPDVKQVLGHYFCLSISISWMAMLAHKKALSQWGSEGQPSCKKLLSNSPPEPAQMPAT